MDLLSLRTASDVPFVHRLSIIFQTLSDDVRSPDLITDAGQLLDLVKNVPIEEGALKETCPACQLEVPLTDVRKAVCSNGHVWSMSSFRRCNDPEAQPGLFSSVFCHNVHFIDRLCADMHWMQEEGVPTSFCYILHQQRKRREGSASTCASKRSDCP